MNDPTITITTTLGTNPRVIASGGNMFRIIIETDKESSDDLWSTYASGDTELLLYENSCDDDPVIGIRGLPNLDDTPLWQAFVINSIGWIEIIVYPIF